MPKLRDQLVNPTAWIISEDVASLRQKIQQLLNHCPDDECTTCAIIMCPHSDPMHFHHDGCPSCVTENTWPKSVTYTVNNKGGIVLPTGAPFDGQPVLIRTNTGWVEAYWEPGSVVRHQEGEEYEGFIFVCYDDEFTVELDEAKEWMPIPKKKGEGR